MKILLAIIFLSLTSSLYSQTYYGIKGGPLISNFFEDSRPIGEYKVGAYAGPCIVYFFAENFFYQVDASYENKGITTLDIITNDSSIIGEELQKIELQYLNLSGQAYFAMGERNNGYIGVGPFLGVMLFGKQKIRQTYTKPGYRDTLKVSDKKEFFEKYEMGISARIGKYIPLGDDYKIHLGINFNIGLTPINYYHDNFSFNNKSLIFEFGFLYLLSGDNRKKY